MRREREDARIIRGRVCELGVLYACLELPVSVQHPLVVMNHVCAGRGLHVLHMALYRASALHQMDLSSAMNARVVCRARSGYIGSSIVSNRWR